MIETDLETRDCIRNAFKLSKSTLNRIISNPKSRRFHLTQCFAFIKEVYSILEALDENIHDKLPSYEAFDKDFQECVDYQLEFLLYLVLVEEAFPQVKATYKETPKPMRGQEMRTLEILWKEIFQEA